MELSALPKSHRFDPGRRYLLFLLSRILYRIDIPDVLAGLGTESHPKRTTKRLYYQPSLTCDWYASIEIEVVERLIVQVSETCLTDIMPVAWE